MGENRILDCLVSREKWEDFWWAQAFSAWPNKN